MNPTLALLCFIFFSQMMPVELTIVTVPIDSNLDIPLSPAGKVEVRLDKKVARLKVKVERIQPLIGPNQLLRSYVVWSVTPEGTFENIGELELDRQKGELETATRFQRFGILVTAEPHFMVDEPSSVVAFTSRAPRDDKVRIENASIETGLTDYSQISLPPQGSLPARVTQARMAFKVATIEEAEQFAVPAFRKARVAIDSMEQLLKRNIPLELLLPYANDAIRLAHRSTILAKAQPIINELDEMAQRADSLNKERERLIQEVERIDKRQSDAIELLDRTRSELITAERKARNLGLEKQAALREARAAESQIAKLEQRWPPLERALVETGARRTARGLLVTLSGEHFDSGKATLKAETRETLARFVGIITFGISPTIRIEGHTDNSGPEDKNLILSRDRAAAIQEFFMQAGILDDHIYAEGYGSARPVAPNENAESRALNRRVDILFREP